MLQIFQSLAKLINDKQNGSYNFIAQYTQVLFMKIGHLKKYDCQG